MRRFLTVTVFAFIFAGVGASIPVSARDQQTLESLPLLTESAVAYLGSFRVPDSDGAGATLTYGGLLGLGSRGDSLWWRTYNQLAAEVSIPPVGKRAKVLQPARDIFEGRKGLISPGASGITLGGVLSWNGRMVTSGYVFYDANGTAKTSHIASSSDLGVTGDVVGPVRVGTTVPVGATAGYMGVIPSEWRDVFGGPALTGQCCISIIWRTSSGPSVSVFNPDDIGRAAPVPATPLLYYPTAHQLAQSESTNPMFNQTTSIGGVAFPSGTRSVLFFGRHGTGQFCYGSQSKCVDPTNGNQGGHAYPYVHQVWAYDAMDLLKVRRGELQPWEPRPYATWTLTEMSKGGNATVAGMAYDQEKGRLYISQQNGAGDQIVHVYEIDGGGGGVTPAPAPGAGPEPPGTPTRLVAAVKGSQVDLTWLAPITGGAPTGYVVEAGVAPGKTDQAIPVPSETRFTVKSVGTGRYYVRVRAKNAVGLSAPSEEVTVSVGCKASPRAPQNFTANTNGSLVTFAWVDPDGCSGTSYALLVGSKSGASDIAQVPSQAATLSAFAWPGVYYVRVVAQSSLGQGTPSQELRVVIGGQSCKPPSFGLKLTSSVTGSHVSLTWKPSDIKAAAVADSVSPPTYSLEIGAVSGSSNLGSLPLGRAVAFDAFAPRGTYYARVRPSDACGAGTASNEVKIVVP